MSKKPAINLNTAFVFKKENHLGKRFTLTVEQIKEKYIEWLKKKDKSDLIYYGNMTVNAFIMSKDGLEAYTEDSNIPVIQNLLMEVRIEYLKNLEDGK